MKINNITKKAAGLGAILVTLGVLGANAVSIVSAATVADNITNSSQRVERQMPPKLEDVTRTVTNTADGVTITMSSTDAATVTKLQEREAKGFGPGEGGGRGGHGGPGGEHGRGGEMDQNVTRTATKISNGIELTMTSTDADTVAKLQTNKRADAPKDSNVTVTQTNIDNGVKVTLTSTDAATVTKLQSMPQRPDRNEQGPNSQVNAVSQQ